MKQHALKLLVSGFLFASVLGFSSCKGKDKKENTTVTPTETQVAPPPAPVEISTDNTLQTGVKDATKDFPGVTATVNDGEITLSGNIERSRLQTLMQSLNSLKPKKINNNLNIK